MKTWLSETLDLGIHALTGGQGTTVVLVPGWPETAEAYSEVFPLLAKNHSVIAVDAIRSRIRYGRDQQDHRDIFAFPHKGRLSSCRT